MRRKIKGFRIKIKKFEDFLENMRVKCIMHKGRECEITLWPFPTLRLHEKRIEESGYSNTL